MADAAASGHVRRSRLQIAVDCAEPRPLVTFWALALGYEPEPAPEGHPGWNSYWRSIGVPESELNDDSDLGDSIVDPAGIGPRIWFQVVPEPKVVKNRLHLDIDVSGGRSVPLELRKERVLAAVHRLVEAGATRQRVSEPEGMNQFAVTLQDPAGNEFCVY